jgi:hypothetical protein
MNIKPILVSVGDLSLSQLLICQVANTYFKSANFKNTHYGITPDILMSNDEYIAKLGGAKTRFLFKALIDKGVITESGHPGTHFNLVINKVGIKSKPVAVSLDRSKPVLERQQDFMKAVFSYSASYPNSMLQEFFDYWGPIDQKLQTMRYEDKEYFELPKRLAMWARRGGYVKNQLDFTMNS